MDISDFKHITNFYNFSCTNCGNCCTGDQKIHLALYDLYRLARFNKFRDTRQLFDSGIIVLVKTERNVFIPRIRFKVKPFQFCPYLINQPEKGLCSLHPNYKPLICSLAPVGHVVDFENNEQGFLFVKPAPDCPGVDSPYSNLLEDVIKKYEVELDYQKRFFALLNKIQNHNWKRDKFINDLYSLTTEQGFEEQLYAMEQKINNS